MAKKKLTLEDMLMPVDDIPYEVPENWCWVKLGNICEIKTGRKDANHATEDGEYPFFTCASEPLKSPTYSFDGECILLAGNGANVGLALYYDGKLEAYQRTYVLKSEYINMKYLLYNLNFRWKDYNEDKQFGSATNYIKLGNITEFEIPIPPLAEQERIVKRIESLFDKVDRAVELVDEARDGFEKRRAAILERAFSGELTKKWREENGVNDEWNKVKLSDICEIIMGQSPKGSSYNDIGEGVPLVNGPVEFGPTHFSKTVKSKWTTQPTKMCKELDLLLCVRGSTLGRINIAGFEACIGRGVAAIRAKEGIEQKYINYIIHSMRSEIYNIGTGTTFPNISSQQIKDIEIDLPSIDEQRELVKILDKLLDNENSIEEVSHISNNIEVIKKSILAKAFRGELGSNDLNEESSIELLKELIK